MTDAVFYVITTEDVIHSNQDGVKQLLDEKQEKIDSTRSHENKQTQLKQNIRGRWLIPRHEMICGTYYDDGRLGKNSLESIWKFARNYQDGRDNFLDALHRTAKASRTNKKSFGERFFQDVCNKAREQINIISPVDLPLDGNIRADEPENPHMHCNTGSPAQSTTRSPILEHFSIVRSLLQSLESKIAGDTNFAQKNGRRIQLIFTMVKSLQEEIEKCELSNIEQYPSLQVLGDISDRGNSHLAMSRNAEQERDSVHFIFRQGDHDASIQTIGQ